MSSHLFSGEKFISSNIDSFSNKLSFAFFLVVECTHKEGKKRHFILIPCAERTKCEKMNSRLNDVTSQINKYFVKSSFFLHPGRENKSNDVT